MAQNSVGKFREHKQLTKVFITNFLFLKSFLVFGIFEHTRNTENQIPNLHPLPYNISILLMNIIYSYSKYGVIYYVLEHNNYIFKSLFVSVLPIIYNNFTYDLTG